MKVVRSRFAVQIINFVWFQGFVFYLLGVAVVSSAPVDYSEYAAPQILHAPIAAKVVVPEPVVR